MFCSKCHTHITNDSTKFCPRCGEEIIKNKRKSSFSSSFSSSIGASNTFKYMSKYGKKDSAKKYDYENLKGVNDDIAEEIANNYCNIEETAGVNTHGDQFNYNIQYSGVKKRSQSHDQQFNYSKNYSSVTKKGKTHDQQYAYSQAYSIDNSTQTSNQTYAQPTPVTSDDSYRLAFIGANKESIIKSKFSFPTLLLGPYYLIYRKLFGIGIILLIVNILSNVYLGENGFGLNFFINLTMAFKFRNIYLSHVNSKVKIIRDKNNDKTSSEIMYICSKQGGTTSIKTIIILLIITYFITGIISGINQLEKETNKSNTNNDYQKIDYIDTYENNKLKYTFEEYEFEKQNGLIQKSSSPYTQVYEYKQNNSDQCTIQLNKVSTNISPRSYLLNKQQELSTYYNNISNIYSENRNNKIWYRQYYSNYNSTDKIVMYITRDTISNSNVYTITTTQNQYNNCEQVVKNITDTFKRKN